MRIERLPADLAGELDEHDDARRFFEGLTPTSRRSYVEWIGGARGTKARECRIAEVVDLLTSGWAARPERRIAA